MRKVKFNQKGFGLTEVVIALAVFGIVGASIMTALNASSETIISAHEITIAESLNRTIIEYVKRSPYDSTSATPVYDSDVEDYGTLLGLDGEPYYGDYTVDVDITRLDPEADGSGDDDGIQKITVQVIYDSRTVLTTEAYKVNR
ncbi:prepilin-type N-terminal cleavage/methylation domain-containing protein [Chloroflexota bacterium]